MSKLIEQFKQQPKVLQFVVAIVVIAVVGNVLTYFFGQ